MTGAPKIGVTAFKGMTPDSPGSTQSKLHNKAKAPPESKVTGIKELWLEVPSIRRAKCGTASPIKATGPQKDVVTAVNKPVASNSQLRTRRIFMPRFSA